MSTSPQALRVSHQINDYFCGPASAVTVLQSYGIRTTQRKVAQLADTNRTAGTSTKGLVSAIGHYGVEVKAGNGRTFRDLARALKRGANIIVCYTEPQSNEGHYAVVVGFREGEILLLDPYSAGYEPVAMPLKEFEGRWKEERYTHSKRWAAFITQ